MAEPHECGEQCVCPVHGSPLVYWPYGDDHACQDSSCEFAHGMDRGFPRLVDHLVTERGYHRNECAAHCPDHGTGHAHLRYPDGGDFIVWPDGRHSGYDLTLPARLIYPAPKRRR